MPTFVATDPAGYEKFVGRSSQRLAPLFVEYAGVTAGERVLDVGCGTGNLTAALAGANVAVATGIDLSASYIEYARRRVTDRAAVFEVGDDAVARLLDLRADVQPILRGAKALGEPASFSRPPSARRRGQHAGTLAGERGLHPAVLRDQPLPDQRASLGSAVWPAEQGVPGFRVGRAGIWVLPVKRKGSAASTAANPLSSMVAGAGFRDSQIRTLPPVTGEWSQDLPTPVTSSR